MLMPVSKRTIYFFGACAVAALGIGYWWFFSLPAESVDTFTGEYELSFTDYEGTVVELSEFKRKLLLVHSWASWCPYCGEELQNLAKLKEQFGDEIEILAINRAEPERDARAFTESLGIDSSQVELLFDPDDTFFRSINGYAMPETVFINARGEIVFHQRGPMDINTMTEHILTLMGKKGLAE